MQNIHIAMTIKELCKKQDITLKQLLENCNLSKSFIYDLEKRKSSPSCDKITRVADYLQCSVDYLLGRTDDPYIKVKNKKQLSLVSPAEAKSIIMKPFYIQPASAGTGAYLFDDIPAEWINVTKNSISESSDFIIQVRGDSMLPKFHNDDKVFVKISPSIHEGEIGVFIMDGESYIKQMGRGELISINPDYENISITSFSDCRCVGKVLGKIE